MNYIAIGDRNKTAVVFLHGWGGSIDSWGVIPVKIASFGFYSIVVDFPGFGKTPEPAKPYGVQDYVLELKNLLSMLGVDSCVLIGHSFGGRVAIKFASCYNDVVSKLILVDSAGVLPRRGIIHKFKVWSYKRAKIRAQKGLIPISKLEKYGSEDYKILSNVMKATFVKVVNEDLVCDARKIECETLLVWGRNDKSTPLYMAKKLNKEIKNSRLEIYCAGHFSYLECMEQFIDEIYIFMIFS